MRKRVYTRGITKVWFFKILKKIEVKGITMSVIINLNFFSPRWSRNDEYEVKFTREYMDISVEKSISRLTWVEGCDPKWSGEPLISIMSDDRIYAPAIIPELFEFAWKAWRNNELNEQEISNELLSIAEWVNTVTKAKPSNDFWNVCF